MDDALADFERVFTQHVAFAWRVLARYGVAERDLDDACQEVFLVVHRNLPQFEGRSALKTWIHGICRRVASHQRGRAGHARELLGQQLYLPVAFDDTDGDAFAQLANKQSVELLDALLARLVPEQREVFVLHDIEELPMREVADVLECSSNTAFSRLYAARREIEAELKRLRARRRVA